MTFLIQSFFRSYIQMLH